MLDLIGHIGNGITIAKSLTEISRKFENSELVKEDIRT